MASASSMTALSAESERLRDPLPRAPHQARRPEHLEIGVDQRRDFSLALLGQHREPAAQLWQLLARLQDRVSSRAHSASISAACDLVAGDLGGRLGGAKDRADRDAGGDGDAGEALLRPRSAGFRTRGRRLCCGGGGAAACSSGGSFSILFIEAGLDQRGQRVQRLLRVPALGAQLHRRALAGAQHHETHDRAGRDTLWPSFTTSTEAPKRSAMVTNLAAARACSPRRLGMMTIR